MALSDFDCTHRLVLSYRYAIPFFSYAHGLQSAVLGHWSVGGVTVFQSGLPFRGRTDSLGASAYGTPIPNTATPSLAPGYTLSSALTTGTIEQRLTGYLNPAAFVPAPVVGIDGSTGFGTLGRNVFRGPFQQNWDMSLAKSWTLTESLSSSEVLRRLLQARGIIPCSTSHPSPISRIHRLGRSPTQLERPGWCSFLCATHSKEG